MIEIREFVVSEHLATIKDLMRAHWLETESDAIESEPQPVVEMYQAAEQAGQIVAYAAFEGSQMVGYVTMFVSQHLHYGFIYGAHDTLFVRHDKRNSTLGLRLMAIVEQHVKARGAKFRGWHAKPGSALEKILLAKGFKAAETIFTKDF